MDILHLKHRLVTSPFGDVLKSVRRGLTSYRQLRNPELGLLYREDPMMEVIVAKALQRDSVCVDVGAHIGSMTQLFQKLAPKGAHVVIEAMPDKASWLRTAFPGLSVVQTAVSDREGEVSFFENLDRPGFSSLGARAGRTREVTVPCTTLDALLADRERIDLIKIDVEGFELDVVKGARDLLARCHPLVIFEAGSAVDKDIDNANYIALLDLFNDELGYEVRPVFGEYFQKPPITQAEFLAYRTYPYQAFNYVARPKPSM